LRRERDEQREREQIEQRNEEEQRGGSTRRTNRCKGPGLTHGYLDPRKKITAILKVLSSAKLGLR